MITKNKKNFEIYKNFTLKEIYLNVRKKKLKFKNTCYCRKNYLLFATFFIMATLSCFRANAVYEEELRDCINAFRKSFPKQSHQENISSIPSYQENLVWWPLKALGNGMRKVGGEARKIDYNINIGVGISFSTKTLGNISRAGGALLVGETDTLERRILNFWGEHNSLTSSHTKIVFESTSKAIYMSDIRDPQEMEFLYLNFVNSWNLSSRIVKNKDVSDAIATDYFLGGLMKGMIFEKELQEDNLSERDYNNIGIFLDNYDTKSLNRKINDIFAMIKAEEKIKAERAIKKDQ